MAANAHISADLTDDIDLAALWYVIWAYKAVIASITIAAALVAVLLAITATPIFRAEVTITQADDQGLGATGALTSQLSGLASLAGVNLGGGQGSQSEAIAVLKSNHLIEEFIKRNDLLPILFGNSDQPPTLWRGVRMFQRGVVNIREDTRQGTIYVAIEWKDPAVAARWANEFVALANELVRKHALEESTRNIAYLKDQVTRTDDVDLRRVLYDLIENETKTAMLANGRSEYAFTVVDPAVAPEIKTSPHRAIMVLIGLALGFAVGIVIAFLHRALGGFKRRLVRDS